MVGLYDGRINWNEGATVDLDKFLAAVGRLNHLVTSSSNTRKILLEGWNFLEDLANTLHLSRDLPIFRDKDIAKMYAKLVMGNNLPSLTPEGKSYTPIWTVLELKKFKPSIRELWHLIIKKAPNLILVVGQGPNPQ